MIQSAYILIFVKTSSVNLYSSYPEFDFEEKIRNFKIQNAVWRIDKLKKYQILQQYWRIQELKFEVKIWKSKTADAIWWIENLKIEHYSNNFDDSLTEYIFQVTKSR